MVETEASSEQLKQRSAQQTFIPPGESNPAPALRDATANERIYILFVVTRLLRARRRPGEATHQLPA
jgi:hypothetical protein